MGQVGFTAGCPGCNSYLTKTRKKEHTDGCRERVIREMERLGMPGVQRPRDAERRMHEHRTQIAAANASRAKAAVASNSEAQMWRLQDKGIQHNQQHASPAPLPLRPGAQPCLIVSSGCSSTA